MGVDISHLVLISLRHTGDQVVNDRLDCSECGDILSRAMVDFDPYCLEVILALLFGKGECDCDVGKIFCEFAYESNKSAF